MKRLFPGSIAPFVLCEDACDCNDDGQFNLADTICILSSLFGSNPIQPVAPYPNCGTDPTDTDALGCAAFMSCP